MIRTLAALPIAGRMSLAAPRGFPLAKNKHTFAKRQREMEKRRKAEQKRLKKHKTPQPSDLDQLSG